MALLAWAAVVVSAFVVVILRAQQATAGATVSLPLVAAQLCMVAMIVAAPIMGASAILTSRGLLRSPARGVQVPR